MSGSVNLMDDLRHHTAGNSLQLPLEPVLRTVENGGFLPKLSDVLQSYTIG